MNHPSVASRWRPLIGLIAGVFLVLSSAAHSLLGWQELSIELATADVNAELIRSLSIGWHFGGAAMLAFGCVAIWSCWQVWRGRAVSLVPTGLNALVYLAFGIWALATSGNLFFLVFIIPGLMMGIAALPKRSA